jgi:copper chaperone CopZ
MSVETARLNTTGLHCPSCSMLVDMTLGDLDGVVESKTDHATGVTVVSFDSDATQLGTIIGAIRSVGYDAEPVA